MSRQLTLNVRLKDDASFANYVPGPNREAVDRLQHVVTELIGHGRSRARGVYLWGEPGVGKSHLLQAACHAVKAQHLNPFYLPVQEYPELSPTVLESLEAMPLVAIDDIDTLAGTPVWEEALFTLSDQLMQTGGVLLTAAQNQPGQLAVRLPDLRTRLQWGLVYPLYGLDDRAKQEAIRRRALARGFELSEEVAHYIFKRYRRDMTSLFQLLERIDDQSLSSQRRITIPFLRSLEERRP